MSGTISPVLLEASEPLEFKIEWLSPVVNDVHSRSRVQSILLSYLRMAINHLRTHFPPGTRPTDNDSWKRFLETLKMLTALEILQAPPLRAALSSLWVAYLRSGNSISVVVTGATWLLEQLRPLSTQSQACVFAECTSLVFVEFRKSLLPLAHDCATHLIRFCQSHLSNGALATVASEGLVALTKEGAIFLEKLSPTVLTKVCLPLLECSSARLRINGALLLVNLLMTGAVLGGGSRRAAREAASRMLESSVREERQAAVQLLATIFSSLSLATNTTGEHATRTAPPPSKIVESWVKLNDKRGASVPAELLCSILIQAMTLVGWNDEFPDLLLRQHSLSFSIVPEAKRKLWRIPSAHLRLILGRLSEAGGDVGEVATRLLSTPVREEHAFTIKQWYLKLIATGVLRLPEPELLNLPIKFSIAKLTPLTVKALCASVANDPGLSLTMILSLFAQLKGDQVLMLSGDNSVTSETLCSVASSLAALLRASVSKDAFPSGLYRPLDQIAQIKAWCMSQERGSCFDSALWEVLASLYGLGLISGEELVVKITDRPPTPSQLQADDALIELDLGPIYFIQTALSSGGQFKTPMMDTMITFVTEQWRVAARIPDEKLVEHIKSLGPLSQVTSQIVKRKPDSNVIEVASTVAARIICSVPTEADDADYTECSSMALLSNSQDILVHHFRNCSSSAMKFYLSQLNIFSKSPPMRTGIFYTAFKLLEVINLAPLSQEDTEFIVDTFKDLLFPFVWETDDLLQSLGAASLGRLVRMVGKRAFRDGMLQELIDRSLNESRDHHRRGYILGMAEVYAAVPENGSHLDIKLVIGLLCSLARDPRSLLVQAAAIEAMHKVLDARSNSFTVILTGDIVYLIWQIYMSDHNAGSLATLDGAVERILLGPIARTLLVLLEMLGPEISDPGTIPRICRLLVGEFMEYANFEMCEFGGPEEESLMGLFLDAVLQMLLIRQQEFSDDIPSLLRLIRTVIQGKSSMAISKALGCLRWLLQFSPQAVLDQGVSLSQSLLMIAPGAGNKDGKVCLQQLFEATFVPNVTLWLDWALHAQVFKAKSTRTPIMDGATFASSPLQKGSALLQQDVEASADIFSPSISSVMTSTLGEGLIPQINRPSLVELITLIVSWLEPAPGKEPLDVLFEASSLAVVIDGIIRLTMALLILPSGVAEGGVQELKLGAIKLIVALIQRTGHLADPVDRTSPLLDTFQSQLVAIFSTASQQQPHQQQQREQGEGTDMLVSTQALCSLLDLLPSINGLQLARHAKLALLTKRAISLLAAPSEIWETEQLSLYCRASLACALLNSAENYPRLSAEQVTEVRKHVESLQSTCIDEILRGVPLDQCICDLFPSLLLHHLSLTHLPLKQQPTLSSCSLLLCRASIQAPNYWTIILRMAEMFSIQGDHPLLSFFVGRVLLRDQLSVPLALSIIRSGEEVSILPPALGRLALKKALSTVVGSAAEVVPRLSEHDVIGLLSLDPSFWPSVFLILSRLWPNINRSIVARIIGGQYVRSGSSLRPLSDAQLRDVLVLLRVNWTHREYVEWILSMVVKGSSVSSPSPPPPPIPALLVEETITRLGLICEACPEEALPLWLSLCKSPLTSEIALRSAPGLAVRLCQTRVGMTMITPEVLVALPAGTIRDCLAILIRM